MGHPVSLYSYDPITGVPDGVYRRDARDVLPRKRFIRHKATGSPALGSNLFRYELMRLGLGCWIDMDVYFLKPFEFDPGTHVFGWEDENILGTAVLQIPKQSPLLADLLSFLHADPIVPPWWADEEQAKQRLLASQGRAVELEEMPWGTAGPRALTYFAERNSLLSLAMPKDEFYPIHWSKAKELYGADAYVREHFTPRTKAVHLWNAMIGHLKNAPPDPASFVARICSEQNVALGRAINLP